jgi:hypothetical protein
MKGPAGRYASAHSSLRRPEALSSCAYLGTELEEKKFFQPVTKSAREIQLRIFRGSLVRTPEGLEARACTIDNRLVKLSGSSEVLWHEKSPLGRR